MENFSSGINVRNIGGFCMVFIVANVLIALLSLSKCTHSVSFLEIRIENAFVNRALRQDIVTTCTGSAERIRRLCFSFSLISLCAFCLIVDMSKKSKFAKVIQFKAPHVLITVINWIVILLN